MYLRHPAADAGSRTAASSTTRILGLIAINVAFQTGFCTFVLVELHEDDPALAQRGGARRRRGRLAPVLAVVLPLCRPALAALAVLEFTFIYNDFLWAIVLMKSGNKLPITSSLNNLQGISSRQQPDRRRVRPRRDPDDPRLRAAAAAVHQRADAGGEQGMSGPRIAFIGAGSVVFTKNLLGDLLAFPELRDVADRAARHRSRPARDRARRWREYVARERRRVADDHGTPRPARGARRRGLRAEHGADRRPRGDPARLRAAGALRVAADDRGHARHRRDLPDAADGADICSRSAARWPSSAPSAWLLNYTNPMAMLCWLVYGGTPTQNVVGLCHSVQFTTRRHLGARRGAGGGGHVPLGRAQPPGVHPPLRARRARDLYPRLDARDRRATRSSARRVRVAVYRRLRLLPDRVERAPGRVRAVVHAPRRARSSASGSRSTSTSAAARRTSPSSSASRRCSRAASRCRSSARTSTRRRSSTRWRRASRA